ncbi:MAG: response regulator [Bdellovibrionales bacterium]
MRRILIVEDASDIRFLLAELLDSEGYVTASVANGQEAIDYLVKSSDLPDLILLDLMMPKMDGYQFRQAQKGNSRIADIPVVIMTADGDIQSKAGELTAKGMLKKPFSDIDDILRTISHLLAS